MWSGSPGTARVLHQSNTSVMWWIGANGALQNNRLITTVLAAVFFWRVYCSPPLPTRLLGVVYGNECPELVPLSPRQGRNGTAATPRRRATRGVLLLLGLHEAEVPHSELTCTADWGRYKPGGRGPRSSDTS